MVLRSMITICAGSVSCGRLGGGMNLGLQVGVNLGW